MPAEGGHLNIGKNFLLFLVGFFQGVAVGRRFSFLALGEWPFTSTVIPVAVTVIPVSPAMVPVAPSFNKTFRFRNQRLHGKFQLAGALFNFK